MNLFNTFLLFWKHLVKTDCRYSPEYRERKEEYTLTGWLEWEPTLFLPEKNVKIISQLWLNNNSDLIHWPQAHTPKRTQLQTHNGNMNIRIFLSNLYWKALGQVFFRIPKLFRIYKITLLAKTLIFLQQKYNNPIVI